LNWPGCPFLAFLRSTPPAATTKDGNYSERLNKVVLGCKNWRHIHGWGFGPTFAHFPLSFPVVREPATVSAGSIGGKNLAKRFGFVSVKGGGEFLPAPSMKEAMPHDAQRSAPGSRAHEPIDCYAKFCKWVVVIARSGATKQSRFFPGLLHPAKAGFAMTIYWMSTYLSRSL